MRVQDVIQGLVYKKEFVYKYYFMLTLIMLTLIMLT